ncbi:regulator SirB [Ketobacter sp. MCCC 1A13808]|uniref:SirB2 family protein n=1 Tax=Ketobacter sp. MCCC 1A13808 TaxID=2602738 RepID=UPI000F0EFE15|nr:SirB2 family protein [Ketobacter sp. MCCC 1A13808]MVF12906.1 regulator SirB [Ketobacter sp. MCCC 1A13808]RLP54425.1 MAG: regulator SirB [Ketobacter sp.]
MYLAFKHSHMMFAVISGLLFLIRGFWMMANSGMLQKKWVKILPHVNDTLLLLCAIVLCVMSQQYPIQQDWLTVKVVALIAYIVLGVVALKRGKTKTIRIVAFFAALLAFIFTMSVARTHNPMGFFSLL